LQKRRRSVASAEASSAAGITIRDPRTGLEWAAALSPTEMTFEEALRYVANLEIGGSRGWRLPTRTELESIIDPAALSDKSNPNPFPLREPFNSQRTGYLHSGTLVLRSKEDNFIMNVQNGHIFNGRGYKCFVRALRGASNSASELKAESLTEQNKTPRRK
jgi:Protein of unknown function (DUF1566)